MPESDEQSFACPYCWSQNSVLIDFSAGANQEIIQDCEICCAPFVVSIRLDGEDVIFWEARRENG